MTVGISWEMRGGAIASRAARAETLLLVLLWVCFPVFHTAPAQEANGVAAALALEQAVVQAIARAEKSVVAIQRMRNESPPIGLLPPGRGPLLPGRLSSEFHGSPVPTEFSTGIVLDDQGHIATTYHSLADPEKNRYVVWSAGRRAEAVAVKTPAEVKAGDPWTDLAVLKVDLPGLTPMPLGDGGQVKKGQFVVALGNPYGIAREGEVSASWGIISNLRRQIPHTSSELETDSDQDTLYRFGGLIQTDAKLNLGTSGGALVNLKGEMVGLITALAATEGVERSTGYAIPVNETFKNTVNQLKTGHRAEFGFLGVSMEDLSDEYRRRGQAGARISRVVPGTPAAAARLRDGDLITHVDRQAILDRDDAMYELGSKPVGADVRLTIQRGFRLGAAGRSMDALVSLSKKHIPSMRPAYSQIQPPRWRGMAVDFATALPTALLDQAFRHPMPEGALAVLEVAPESVAWKAGLRPGNLITHVEETRVTTPEQFDRLVESREDPVRLVVVSGPGAEVRVVPPETTE